MSKVAPFLFTICLIAIGILVFKNNSILYPKVFAGTGSTYQSLNPNTNNMAFNGCVRARYTCVCPSNLPGEQASWTNQTIIAIFNRPVCMSLPNLRLQLADEADERCLTGNQNVINTQDQGEVHCTIENVACVKSCGLGQSSPPSPWD